MTAVVGLDLSLTATGIATAEGVCTVASKGRAGDGLRTRRERLQRITGAVHGPINEAARAGGWWSPALVVVEAPAFDSRTGHQHDRSGLWWLLVEELLREGNQVVEVTTGSLKKYATGKGNAGKDEVLAAVVRRYPDVEVTNNNEADALVLRAMGCDWLGQPLAVVPQTHRAALDKVAWPEGLSAA